MEFLPVPDGLGDDFSDFGGAGAASFFFEDFDLDGPLLLLELQRLLGLVVIPLLVLLACSCGCWRRKK